MSDAPAKKSRRTRQKKDASVSKPPTPPAGMFPYDEDEPAVFVASSKRTTKKKTAAPLESSGPITYVPPKLSDFVGQEAEDLLGPVGDETVATATETPLTDKDVDDILDIVVEHEEVIEEPMEVSDGNQGEEQTFVREPSLPAELNTGFGVIRENLTPLQEEIQAINDASEDIPDDRVLVHCDVFDALKELPNLVAEFEAQSESVREMKSQITSMLDPTSSPLLFKDDAKQFASKDQLKEIADRLLGIEQSLESIKTVGDIDRKVDIASKLVQETLNITRGLSHKLDHKNRELGQQSTDQTITAKKMVATLKHVTASAHVVKMYSAARLSQLDSPHPLSVSRPSTATSASSTTASAPARKSELVILGELDTAARGYNEAKERHQAEKRKFLEKAAARKLNRDPTKFDPCQFCGSQVHNHRHCDTYETPQERRQFLKSQNKCFVCFVVGCNAQKKCPKWRNRLCSKCVKNCSPQERVHDAALCLNPDRQSNKSNDASEQGSIQELQEPLEKTGKKRTKNASNGQQGLSFNKKARVETGPPLFDNVNDGPSTSASHGKSKSSKGYAKHTKKERHNDEA